VTPWPYATPIQSKAVNKKRNNSNLNVPFVLTTNRALEKFHFVASESSSFITEDVLDLTNSIKREQKKDS
jgi:hypothetical protein